MGSSESKIAASASVKPEPPLKNKILHLDPRSPSTGIDRTPIQVFGPVPKAVAEVKNECPLSFTDPRSPSVGISRTPVRDVMRVTVGSFARRLGMLFHNETEGIAPEAPQKCFSDSVEEEEVESEELASTEPLLTLKPSFIFSSLAEHANLLATPERPTLQSTDVSSPFVHLDDPQVEVEVETEADFSLEEAEEARESPLNKRLSMSLITCHEGATSSQIFAEVHRDGASPPVQSEEVEPFRDGVDHSYALPTIAVDSPVEPSLPTGAQDSPAPVLSEQQAEQPPSSVETKEILKESTSSEPPTVTNPEQPQLCTGIRCPTFDSKSPSQAVFKPQWLGKGFGAPGLRSRGAQGGKSVSSPLAVRVAMKNATNENKRQSGKLKQNGIEGRSPLQTLKKTNSPRDQHPQMKLKVSTPDKQRLGQVDHRVLAVCLDKENR
ncbi:cell division cycle-associated protein 3 [Cheilinus undulatus]|uniref:cell division cycle-associated protein 3 n=1 Tax=Cheilinus undulatus TaxID=241271 RepID=UPI001BD4D78A|nr:cell division cycle-associated protein 3 [Cheilinus undulatus]XP_041649774.1 cell division cycle-associated protein 3 [Cheilinus undulatus]